MIRFDLYNMLNFLLLFWFYKYMKNVLKMSFYDVLYLKRTYVTLLHSYSSFHHQYLLDFFLLMQLFLRFFIVPFTNLISHLIHHVVYVPSDWIHRSALPLEKKNIWQWWSDIYWVFVHLNSKMYSGMLNFANRKKDR